MKQIFDVMIKKPFLSKKRNRTFKNYVAKVTRDDLDLLSELLENKQIRPFIDKAFTLKDSKKAFEHFMNKKTIGKTIIKVVE